MHKRVKEMAGAGLILFFIWIIWMILPKHKYAIVDRAFNHHFCYLSLTFALNKKKTDNSTTIENIDDLHLIKNKEFIKYLLDKACFEKKECEVYDLAIEYNKDIDITLKLAKISDNHYLNKIMENLQELKINDDIYFDLLSYNINIIEYAPPNISNTYLEAIMQSFDSIEVNSQDIIILKTDYNSIEINNYENNITIIDTFNRMTSLKKEEYEKFINIFINEINERYPGLEIKNISEVINKINMINKIDLEK